MSQKLLSPFFILKNLDEEDVVADVDVVAVYVVVVVVALDDISFLSCVQSMCGFGFRA